MAFYFINFCGSIGGRKVRVATVAFVGDVSRRPRAGSWLVHLLTAVKDPMAQHRSSPRNC